MDSTHTIPLSGNTDIIITQGTNSTNISLDVIKKKLKVSKKIVAKPDDKTKITADDKQVKLKTTMNEGELVDLVKAFYLITGSTSLEKELDKIF